MKSHHREVLSAGLAGNLDASSLATRDELVSRMISCSSTLATSSDTVQYAVSSFDNLILSENIPGPILRILALISLYIAIRTRESRSHAAISTIQSWLKSFLKPQEILNLEMYVLSKTKTIPRTISNCISKFSDRFSPSVLREADKYALKFYSNRKIWTVDVQILARACVTCALQDFDIDPIVSLVSPEVQEFVHDLRVLNSN